MELSGPNQDILALQPIPVRIKLSNRTSRPVFGYSSIALGKSPLSILAKKSSTDQSIALDTTAILTYTSNTNVEMLPGAVVEAREWLTLGLNKYFPEPGSYELQTVLANDDRTQYIESNTISIEIREPTGADRPAYNFIKNSSFQDYLFSGAEFNKVKGTLERLNTLHPNTPYARSASFVLGENYYYGRLYPQALVNLLRLEADNDFIFADKVRKYLAEIRRSAAVQEQK